MRKKKIRSRPGRACPGTETSSTIQGRTGGKEENNTKENPGIQYLGERKTLIVLYQRVKSAGVAKGGEGTAPSSSPPFAQWVLTLAIAGESEKRIERRKKANKMLAKRGR